MYMAKNCLLLVRFFLFVIADVISTQNFQKLKNYEILIHIKILQKCKGSFSERLYNYLFDDIGVFAFSLSFSFSRNSQEKICS